MKNGNKAKRKDEDPTKRASRLSAAILRISASADLDTVLHEVVESARALTGARYGGMTTLDDSGQLQDFVSSGCTPEERRQLAEWPDGPRVFEHFRDHPETAETGRPARLCPFPRRIPRISCPRRISR